MKQDTVLAPAGKIPVLSPSVIIHIAQELFTRSASEKFLLFAPAIFREYCRLPSRLLCPPAIPGPATDPVPAMRFVFPRRGPTQRGLRRILQNSSGSEGSSESREGEERISVLRTRLATVEVYHLLPVLADAMTGSRQVWPDWLPARDFSPGFTIPDPPRGNRRKSSGDT